jgi:hypothetical protein
MRDETVREWGTRIFSSYKLKAIQLRTPIPLFNSLRGGR